MKYRNVMILIFCRRKGKKGEGRFPGGTHPCNRLCQSSVSHCLENRQKKDCFSSEFNLFFNVWDDYVKLVCSYTVYHLLFSVFISLVLRTNHRLGTCLWNHWFTYSGFTDLYHTAQKVCYFFVSQILNNSVGITDLGHTCDIF